MLENTVMKDRDTGRSRGFGFVVFETADECNAAIAALHDTDWVRKNQSKTQKTRVNKRNGKRKVTEIRGRAVGREHLVI